MTTIFDKILDGEIPNYTVYENEHALAFLDVYPSSRGHTLVIPKNERVKSIDLLSQEAAAGFIVAVQEVNKILKQRLSCEGINHLIADGSAAGQEIMHLHMHLVPRFEGDSLQLHNIGKNIDMSSEEFEELQNRLTSDQFS